jgi:AcrR family transcriptional regulator
VSETVQPNARATRRYRLKRRAEQQEETRRRIVAATVALHEALGPARTSISAIAERAGVERLTVYRHFPDEHALLSACAHHFLSEHPLPDPNPWRQIADPGARLRHALTVVYAYHRETAAMMTKVLRDAETHPVLQALLVPYAEYWTLVRDVLATGWEVRGRRRTLLLAAIGHALELETWCSLAQRQGLSDAEAVELMVGMVCSV